MRVSYKWIDKKYLEKLRANPAIDRTFGSGYK